MESKLFSHDGAAFRIPVFTTRAPGDGHQPRTSPEMAITRHFVWSKDFEEAVEFFRGCRARAGRRSVGECSPSPTSKGAGPVRDGFKTMSASPRVMLTNPLRVEGETLGACLAGEEDGLIHVGLLSAEQLHQLPAGGLGLQQVVVVGDEGVRRDQNDSRGNGHSPGAAQRGNHCGNAKSKGWHQRQHIGRQLGTADGQQDQRAGWSSPAAAPAKRAAGRCGGDAKHASPAGRTPGQQRGRQDKEEEPKGFERPCSAGAERTTSS